MSSKSVSCTLCGLPTYHPITDESDGFFCCVACREVSQLLGDKPQPQDMPAVSFTNNSTTTIQLGGMWCPSCAWLVTERLQRARGVHFAETNFIRREARVQFDAKRTNAGKLARHIRRVGYRAWLDGDKPYDEEEAHWNRLLIGGVLAMKVMVISFIIYVRHWLGLASDDTAWLEHFFGIMMIPLTVGVVLTLGLPIARAGLAALLQRRPNTHSLIALGAFAALGLSIRNVVVGGNIYFDTTCALLFLLAVGRWLEMQAQKESREAVEKLWQRMPVEATWLTAKEERRVPADSLPLGSRVRIRPGEQVPVDGVVVAGQSDVDESWLTGEPEPVLRQIGDSLLAGSMNLDGSLEIVTTATGTETTVGQIGKLLHEAAWQKAPVERIADRIAAWMMPIAVLLSILTFIYWSGQRGVETGLIISLSVLLIACPCALGIATPLTLWLGLGRAANAGILLRRTAVLEQLAQVRHAFFDKTGTLTMRPLQLKHIATINDENRFRSIVTSVEQHSEHPIGQAIANYSTKADLAQLPVTEFETLGGLGVTAQVEGKQVWIGSQTLMLEAKLACTAGIAKQANRWQKSGLRVIYAGWDDSVQGLLGLGEQLRQETKGVINQLQEMQLTVSILTGDNEINGKLLQQKFGIPVHAGLRPEQKLSWIESSQVETLMVGDGINDSPALATATVGLALRQGTDIACFSADGILLHDDLRAIPWLIALSHRTIVIVRQNLKWAFAYNIAGILLALTGYLQPSIAALFMVGSNFVVTANALRLRRWEMPAINKPDLQTTVSKQTEPKQLPSGKSVFVP